MLESTDRGFAASAMRIVLTIAAMLVAAVLASGLAAPAMAHASVKRGTMSIALDQSTSLNCGEKANVNCEVTPMSERQRPCCSTDYCPSGCDVGVGCLDSEGFCTCLGGSYFTATATCSVTSSAPNVARAKWNNGVLSISAYGEGTARITVTAKMTLWVTSSASIEVTVGPSPGGSGEGTGGGDGSGAGTSESAGAADKGEAAGSGGAASGSAQGSVGEGASAANAKEKAGSSSKESTKKTEGATSKSEGKSGVSAVAASSSSKPSTSGAGASGDAGVTVQTVSGGASGDAAAVSVGKNEDTDPSDAVDAKPDDPREIESEPEAGDPSEGDSPSESRVPSVDDKVAASAVSAAGADKQQSPETPVSRAVVGAVAVMATAGAAYRYRAGVRQRAEVAPAVDDPDAPGGRDEAAAETPEAQEAEGKGDDGYR